MHNAEWWIGKNKEIAVKYCKDNNISYSVTELDAKPGINYDTELVVRANMRDDVLYIVIGKFKLNV